MLQGWPGDQITQCIGHSVDAGDEEAGNQTTLGICPPTLLAGSDPYPAVSCMGHTGVRSVEIQTEDLGLHSA